MGGREIFCKWSDRNDMASEHNVFRKNCWNGNSLFFLGVTSCDAHLVSLPSTALRHLVAESNLITSRYRSWGFQKDQAPRFQDSRHKKVLRLSVLSTGHLYPQGKFLVLCSVRGWVDPRAIVRPEGLCQRKIPITPSESEPAYFRVAMQCLNQLHKHVPLVTN